VFPPLLWAVTFSQPWLLALSCNAGRVVLAWWQSACSSGSVWGPYRASGVRHRPVGCQVLVCAMCYVCTVRQSRSAACAACQQHVPSCSRMGTLPCVSGRFICDALLPELNCWKLVPSLANGRSIVYEGTVLECVAACCYPELGVQEGLLPLHSVLLVVRLPCSS